MLRRPLTHSLTHSFTHPLHPRQNLAYTVRNSSNKKEKLNLLDGVTGFLPSGEMVALMGPSGCGKTTLLDVLAGRKTTGKTTGTVLFDGQSATTAFLRRYTGYVEQFDTLVVNMTIQEMLQYTAEMVSPRSEPAASKKARVDLVIEQLALDQCRGVLVGGASRRGASGGQLKRANIALALVGSPKVLFLDEPTTGLDSFTAAEVIDVVRNLTTTTGITVCATIHSPSQHVFGVFDRTLVLLGGRVVHFAARSDGGLGPLASIAGSGIPPRETGLSEAEWLTDLVVKADREGRAGELADRYASSALAKANERQAAALAAPTALATRQRSIKLTQVRRSTETPALLGYWTLVKHRLRADYRDANFLGPRIMDKLIVQLIIMTLYLGIGDDISMSNNPNIVAVIFMFVILPAYTAVSYTPAIVLDRPLYYRERADGLYTPWTYFCFKMTEELLVAIIISPIFASMVYFGVKLQGSFVVVWIAYLLTMCVGIALAYFVAALSPNIDVANAALPAFITASLFFTGNLIRYVDIPAWMRWGVYVDFLHWPFGAITINQFEGFPDAVMVGGLGVLEYFSLDTVGGAWVYLAIEFAFFVGFSVMAWAALAYVRHGSR